MSTMKRPTRTLLVVGGVLLVTVVLLYLNVAKLQLSYYIASVEGEQVSASAAISIAIAIADTTVVPSPGLSIDSISVTTRSAEAAAHHRATRTNQFLSWYEPGHGTDKLRANADQNGTILDFAIAGFPKCGTTTLEANLGYLAPMPIADVCTPVAQTVYYAYQNWPKQYVDKNNQRPNATKLYRGTKCPRFTSDLREWSHHLPKTKLIIGIRHPVLWFQSFWNHQAIFFPQQYANLSPYERTHACDPKKTCSNDCPHQQLFCLHRSRFHLTLAKMGKTPLTDEERQLLAPHDYDGGINVPNHQIRNPVFLYEQTELAHDDFWQGLATYLQYTDGPTIPHDRSENTHAHHVANDQQTSNQVAAVMDICQPQYDKLRQQLMPYAAQMSRWFCEYLVVGDEDDKGNDYAPKNGVTVVNRTRFCAIVQNYDNDPCGRLVRNHSDGTYALLPDIATTIGQGRNATRRST
eukprot:scaffold5479_cov199-Amphora_coffeaeformis.AAC.12